MKVNFKVPRAIDGVTYSKGVHEVPDSLRSHWYFLALLGNSEAMLVSNSARVTGEKVTRADPPIKQPAPKVFDEKKSKAKAKDEEPPADDEIIDEPAPAEPAAETKAVKAARVKKEKADKILAKAKGS